MEKYRKFTDVATGINPFIPPLAPHPARLAAAVVLFPVVVLLAAVPFLLLLLGIALHCGLSAVGLRVVGRLVHPFFAVPATSSLLFLWAQTGVSTAPCPRRPSTFVAAGQSDEVVAPAAGQVVMANLQSPLDAVVLQRVFNRTPVVFAMPRPKGEVAFTANVSSVMQWALDEPTLCTDVVDLAPAQSYAKGLGAPVVFFGEGTSSNGMGVLKFCPARLAAGSAAPAVAGVAYQQDMHRSVIPQGILAWQFRALAGSLCTSTVFVALARPSACPRGAEAPAELAVQAQAKVTQAVAFHRAVCKPMAVADIAEKKKFLEQYRSYTK